MQRLYRARPQPWSSRQELPDRLPGLSRLTRLERAEIDYDRATACIGAVAGELWWEPSRVPDIAPISTRLASFRQPADGVATPDLAEPYQEAVLNGHLSLLIALTGAGATLGKAYGLGRALADTCRPGQEPA